MLDKLAKFGEGYISNLQAEDVSGTSQSQAFGHIRYVRLTIQPAERIQAFGSNALFSLCVSYEFIMMIFPPVALCNSPKA